MIRVKTLTGLSITEAVRTLAARNKSVVGIYRFGSKNQSKLQSAFSDIDLAVVLWPYDKYVAADVALCLPSKFDVTILNEAPAFIIAAVVNHGELLYCRNQKTLARAMMRITADIRRYHDFLVRQGML